MKKFSLMAALAALVTVGGVYAAWTYAGADVKSVDESTGLSIEAATSENPKATITVTPSTDLAFAVENDGSYNTVLNSNGSWEVAVSISAGASISSLDVTCTVTVTGDKSGDYDIFTNDSATFSWNELSDSKSGELTAEELAAQLGFNEYLLDTVEEHAAYSAVLNATKISLSFAETAA